MKPCLNMDDAVVWQSAAMLTQAVLGGINLQAGVTHANLQAGQTIGSRAAAALKVFDSLTAELYRRAGRLDTMAGQGGPQQQ